MNHSPLVRRARRRSGAMVAAFVLAALALHAQQPAEHWVGTWATAQVGRPQNPPPPAQPAAAPAAPFIHFNDQTLRQIARVSVGGPRVRVVLSNVFGTSPLTIGAAAVGLRDRETAIVSGSSRALVFSGQSSITIPAGAFVFSDAVNLTVAPLADVAVDLYLPGSTDVASPLTMHNGALQTSYVSGPGNHAGKTEFPSASTTQSSFVLSRLEVMAPAAVGAVVTFGDSITDGSRSTPDTNNRWPNHLARRLMASPAPMGVLNAGIAANRLLSEGAFGGGVNALARFDRQALGQTAVTHVIVMEGINDIGNARDNASPSADDVIAAHRQLIAQARARGITVIGATLTPFEGANYFTQTGEAKRQAVNRWIRTSNEYDGVIDFDAVIRDPASPARALPQYDSGDHLHPNDAGYRAMGEAVDLALFARTRTAAVSSR